VDLADLEVQQRLMSPRSSSPTGRSSRLAGEDKERILARPRALRGDLFDPIHSESWPREPRYLSRSRSHRLGELAAAKTGRIAFLARNNMCSELLPSVVCNSAANNRCGRQCPSSSEVTP
jgi:hypothetical protein